MVSLNNLLHSNVFCAALLTEKRSMIRDIEHLAYKVDKFEGFGDLDAQLRQVVESKKM